MSQDIITTIKKIEDEANADISKAQETSKTVILAKEKELREKLEKVEETLFSEIKKIEDQVQKETINVEKKEKGDLKGMVGEISQINFEKARKIVLDFLPR